MTKFFIIIIMLVVTNTCGGSIEIVRTYGTEFLRWIRTHPYEFVMLFIGIVGLLKGRYIITICTRVIRQKKTKHDESEMESTGTTGKKAVRKLKKLQRQKGRATFPVLNGYIATSYTSSTLLKQIRDRGGKATWSYADEHQHFGNIMLSNRITVIILVPDKMDESNVRHYLTMFRKAVELCIDVNQPDFSRLSFIEFTYSKYPVESVFYPLRHNGIMEEGSVNFIVYNPTSKPKEFFKLTYREFRDVFNLNS